MAVAAEPDAGWGSVVQDLVASQDSEASLLEEAEACRSSTDTSDSLPDWSLWWVNPLKGHSSGHQRPVPPRTPRTLLSGCTGTGADIMVLKARRGLHSLNYYYRFTAPVVVLVLVSPSPSRPSH